MGWAWNKSRPGESWRVAVEAPEVTMAAGLPYGGTTLASHEPRSLAYSKARAMRPNAPTHDALLLAKQLEQWLTDDGRSADAVARRLAALDGLPNAGSSKDPIKDSIKEAGDVHAYLRGK
ncbi:hypothetical protein ACIBG7_42615 [Nonomuraea sp. NPDC050328]|uniref:hypothetical protein n=1 Tax=Nonomuraea sp. NPDC050328 TaxID=3364361 RepID=UPI0037B4C899